MRESIAVLSIDDVLESHLFQVETYGGDSGLRDAGLLESAIAQPQASFGGGYLHAFPFEMAAAYLFHLVMNHPFVDGNKRVGLETALIFLRWNKTKFRVIRRIVLRVDEFASTVPSRYQVTIRDAIVVRNALCDGLDTVQALAGTQMCDLDKDFSVVPDTDDIVRNWFAVLHLGCLLFTIADRHANGSLDEIGNLALSIGLIGHAYCFEDAWCTDLVIDSILQSPDPRLTAEVIFQNRSQSVLGYPKRQVSLSLHSRILPYIVAAASERVDNPQWSHEVDSWITQCKSQPDD